MGTLRNPDAPCFGCINRTAECHGTCAKYMDYQQKKFAEYEMRAKVSDSKSAMSEYYRKSNQRMKQRKKRYGE